MEPAPPTRPAGSGGYRRANVITTDAAAIGASTPPPRHIAPPPSRPEDSGSTYNSDEETSSGGADSPPPTAAGLTMDAVARTFGGTGAEGANTAASPAGNGAAGVVMPTTKEGNDAASMYSLSQSILPTDPRDRLYYRPRRHLLQCYVRRKKEGNLLKSLLPVRGCSYQFYLEHTNDFVLAARQRGKRSSSKVDDLSDGVRGQSYIVTKGVGNTIFSINAQQLDKDPTSFVGKVSRRGGGREVVLFSEGSKENRKEIAAVLMEPPQDGQRRFKVIVPAIDEETGYMRPLEGGQVRFLRDGRGTTLYGPGAGENSSRAGIDAALMSSSDDEADVQSQAANAPAFKPSGEGQFAAGGGQRAKWRSHSLLVREYLENPRSENIIVMQNKAATWDGALRGYRLDFHGRATKASEKNFQLVPVSHPGKVVMLFGKQGDDRYAVDFRYPLCGIQAAAIATTLMGSKTKM